MGAASRRKEVDIVRFKAVAAVVRISMEPHTLFKLVGAVVLGLFGYVIFGFVAGIVGAAIGIYLGPIVIKKFLEAR